MVTATAKSRCRVGFYSRGSEDGAPHGVGLLLKTRYLPDRCEQFPYLTDVAAAPSNGRSYHPGSASTVNAGQGAPFIARHRAPQRRRELIGHDQVALVAGEP